MAYYCLKCRCWHYPYSDIWYRHKIYASQRPPRRRIVRKGILERLFR